MDSLGATYKVPTTSQLSKEKGGCVAQAGASLVVLEVSDPKASCDKVNAKVEYLLDLKSSLGECKHEDHLVVPLNELKDYNQRFDQWVAQVDEAVTAILAGSYMPKWARDKGLSVNTTQRFSFSGTPINLARAIDEQPAGSPCARGSRVSVKGFWDSPEGKELVLLEAKDAAETHGACPVGGLFLVSHNELAPTP
jgi:hypothetical protein